MSSEMVTVYLSLGSNLGDRQENLDKAIELISHRMRLGLVSSIYETEPMGSPAIVQTCPPGLGRREGRRAGNTEQPRFLNLVCQVFTRLAAKDLLVLVKGFEARLGRVRSTPNAPRPIDIDILFYADQVIETEELTIPHPRLAERSFVLVPLAEIAPDLVHPIHCKTVAEMLKGVTATQGVVKWERKTKEG